MSGSQDATPLTPDEIKNRGLVKASKQKLDDAEMRSLALPPSCSTGHGWCEGGKCFVCCDGQWYKLVDDNGNQISCRPRDTYYECGGRDWLATC
jgi:hypothetical protein